MNDSQVLEAFKSHQNMKKKRIKRIEYFDTFRSEVYDPNHWRLYLKPGEMKDIEKKCEAYMTLVDYT